MKLTLKEAEKMMKNSGGYLDLQGTQIQSLPDNLTVGGYLDLRGTQIQSLPDNLTVGGSLDLQDTPIQSLPDNLTVGGYLDLQGTPIHNKGKERKKVKPLHNGDYVPKRYLYADGILTHIKGQRKVQGYVFYQGRIKGRNVVSDGVNYAHCSTFKEGVQDLVFKAAKDRGSEQYRHLTLDSELTQAEIITAYRIITGACRQGTEQFLSGIKLKDKYTVREAIEITKGQYGAETFKRFFEE